ncbi:MAG: hypothetical protein PHD51_00965 [Patescibacteria group bacterium]|nr:hypothetical protein [Patescibacteria group bacterium]MDD5490566.1 hypothetical protein [Patescibacteria group bacterium]
MSKLTKLTKLSIFVAVFIFLFVAGALSVNYLYAWQGPTAPPAGNNVAAPLNAGSDIQTKTGNLILGGLQINEIANKWLGVSSPMYIRAGYDNVAGEWRTGDNSTLNLETTGSASLYSRNSYATVKGQSGVNIYSGVGSIALQSNYGAGGELELRDYSGRDAVRVDDYLCLNAWDTDLSDGRGCIEDWADISTIQCEDLSCQTACSDITNCANGYYLKRADDSVTADYIINGEVTLNKLTSTGLIYGTQFQDKDNSSYYLDPANSSDAGNLAGRIKLPFILDTDSTYYIDPNAEPNAASVYVKGNINSTFGSITTNSGSINAGGDLTTQGNLSASSNTRDNCAWTPIQFGVGQFTCPENKYVAGIEKDANNAVLKMYCCAL